jgi:hypothetical protein
MGHPTYLFLSTRLVAGLILARLLNALHRSLALALVGNARLDALHLVVFSLSRHVDATIAVVLL